MDNQIVVGIDDSEGGRLALAWAVDQAVRTGDRVTAVLVYPSPLAWIDYGSDAAGAMEAHAKRTAEEAARRITADVATNGDEPTASVDVVTVEGDPALALIEAAKEAELLVVGSRGRGGFAGVLLGSVSQRCAEHADCPVVIVHPRRR